MIVDTPNPAGLKGLTVLTGTVLEVYPMDAEEHAGSMRFRDWGSGVIRYLIGFASYWESYHDLAGAKVKLWLKGDMIHGIYVMEHPPFITVLTPDQMQAIVSILKGETR